MSPRVRGRTMVLSALALAAHVGSPGAAWAQERPDTIPLDSIQYVLEPLEVAVERERSAPPPVGALSIDPVALRRVQASDAYKLLGRVAGIEIHDQGQGPGYASNVVMRGFTSDHSSDVLLVIDGVPVNLPAHGHVEGYADWNVLAPAAVSSVRVLHGNASPLYGDFALAGAVEVFTRADAEGTELTVGGTSFGDARLSLITGDRGSTGGFMVAAEGRRERGWRDGSAYWLTNGLVRGWKEAWSGRVEGGLGVYATAWDSPGFVSVPDFNLERFNEPMDETDGGRSRRVVAHGRFARPVLGSAFLQVVGWGMVSDYALFLHVPGHNHGGVDGLLQQSGEWDERLGGGGQVEIGWTTGTGDVLFGVSGRADDVRYEHAATFSREPIAAEIDLDAGHTAGAVYGRWRLTPLPRLGLDLGARVDVLRHASRSKPDGVRQSATNSIFAPKMGARFRLSGPWYLTGTVARGFRSAVGIIGDPTREPYIAWSRELGLEREGDDWSVELAAFRTTVDNERVFDPVALRSTGAGESTRQGLDAHGSLGLPLGVTIESKATWNHARLSGPYADAHDDHPHEVFDAPTTVTPETLDSDDARRVPGLATYTGSISVSAPVGDRAEARLGWRVVGPHVPIGEPTVETRPYSVLDLGWTWTFGEDRALDVEFGNLLGVRYVELRSGSYVTPGTPRSLRAQLRLMDLPF